ncbi:SIR2 family NAD-dependent protein deacylase [Desulfotruncus alcoholivorax]|uniref:SIR2 family NAD-dependent protein deacylase n=1 Tax=Desulfotruncus alcoholivorax TaxID=265477 RepID=UPI0004091BE2|nr:Sir2 family NAD-dependent protein deacetylase [Desulfotruncus alcoholivorax]
MGSLQEQVAKLAEKLLASQRTVVLTGAGVSTESGIPDFRSPGGLWSKVDPLYAFSAETFVKRPEVFYQLGLPHLASITSAKPNRAHEVLAALEKTGLVSCVVTQNVDGLHQQAGSSRVLEVHGHLRTATCMECGSKISWDFLLEKVFAGQIPPRCTDCRGIFKPDCVFFGDSMPQDFDEAIKESSASELLVVVGSSLEVAPVNYLPTVAGELVIINLGPTMADHKVSLKVGGKAGQVMDLLWENLMRNGLVS